MSKLTVPEVEHIAKLSRLELTDEEKSRFADQLSGVLNYVSQLNEVDTSKIKPTAQVTSLNNVSVADEVTNPEAEFELLKNTPELQETSIKIPAVFE